MGLFSFFGFHRGGLRLLILKPLKSCGDLIIFTATMRRLFYFNKMVSAFNINRLKRKLEQCLVFKCVGLF